MDRVVVYEPRRLVREGMAGYLRREGFDVFPCASPDELVHEFEAGPGGFAIVSFDSGPLDSSAALARAALHVRRFRVLALASVLDQVTARRLRVFGVTDVASPEIGLRGLVDRLRTPPSQCRSMRPYVESADRPARPHLTPRERQIVALVSSGYTAGQIAAELRISAKTVENHKQRVFRKLGVQSQSHAVSVAMRLGLMSSSPPVRAVRS